MDADARVQAGDEVVIMSAPGRFTVLAVDGNLLTLRNDQGVQKTVKVWGVRLVAPRSPEAGESAT